MSKKTKKGQKENTNIFLEKYEKLADLELEVIKKRNDATLKQEQRIRAEQMLLLKFQPELKGDKGFMDTFKETSKRYQSS